MGREHLKRSNVGTGRTVTDSGPAHNPHINPPNIIRITELHWNPPGADLEVGEFVRIYNSTQNEVFITGWSLCTETESGTEYVRINFDCGWSSMEMNGCDCDQADADAYCMSPTSSILVVNNVDAFPQNKHVLTNLRGIQAPNLIFQ